MDGVFDPSFRNITVSGIIAVGTTTLARNLSHILKWKHINAGEIQRQFDRTHGIDENRQGAIARTDEHERQIDEQIKKMLKKESHIIYEAWLSGFMAAGIPNILKVLLICSHEDIRIDRIVNRDNITIKEAKHQIKQREEENIAKWKKLYGDFDFWHPKYYDLVIDTYTCGPMETMGKVLDKLRYKVKHK